MAGICTQFAESDFWRPVLLEELTLLKERLQMPCCMAAACPMW